MNAEPTRREMADVALDSLAAICAAERGDAQGVTHLLNGLDPSEVIHFLIATLGHAGHILRTASQMTGVPPDKIVGHCVAEMRAEQ